MSPTLPLVELVTIDGSDYFFLLTRKCASNSIKAGLRMLGAEFYQKRVPTVANVRENPSIPRIGMVRHPVSRLLSCWRHCVWKRKAKELDNEQIRNNMIWDDFVQVVCCLPDADSNRHFRSAFEDLLIDGKMPDHVLHVEDLDREWRELSRRFNWKQIVLPKHNRTDGPEATVTKDQLQALAVRYLRDSELFGYDVVGWKGDPTRNNAYR